MTNIQFESKRPLDCIPVGRITVDFNPIDYFKPLKNCTTFRLYLGGTPANIAVGLARLGDRAGFIGCISDDQLGDFVYEYLLNEGVDTSHIHRLAGKPLGLTVTEILNEMETRKLMYRENAADLSLHMEMVDEAYIQSAKMLLITGTSLAASPSREATLKSIELARRNNTLVVFDIDYRNYSWESLEEASLYYTMAAKESDIIIGSRDEFNVAEVIQGLDGSDAASAYYWLGHQAKIVIIKHGRKGSSAYMKNGEVYFVKAFPVNMVKRTGGGDGYASAFLHGLLKGWDLPKSLELASASASMLVASHACSDNMANEEQIRAFIREKKAKYGAMVTKGESLDTYINCG